MVGSGPFVPALKYAVAVVADGTELTYAELDGLGSSTAYDPFGEPVAHAEGQDQTYGDQEYSEADAHVDASVSGSGLTTGSTLGRVCQTAALSP
jgi:hypothetical protein